MAAEQKVIIYYKILASKIYSNLGSPNSFLMSTTKQTFLLRPFFAQVRLNFSEKVKIASYSIFCERRPGLGRHFPNYKRLELSLSSPRPWQPVLITPPPGCCWENVSSDCLSRLWSKIPCIIIRVFLLLLAWLWLVVCQHLTKHLQTFSHSLPRPSFPYVLLRLQ